MNELKSISNILWRDISVLGNLVFYCFFMVFVFSLGRVELFFKMFFALILGYIITLFFRIIFYRQRPNKQKYSNFIEKLDSSSFPSMHAIRAVFLFLFVFYNFEEIIIKVLFFVILIFVVLSRYFLKKHYIGDLIGGIFFGVLIWLLIEFLFL